jgi:hypothetical protein
VDQAKGIEVVKAGIRKMRVRIFNFSTKLAFATENMVRKKPPKSQNFS